MAHIGEASVTYRFVRNVGAALFGGNGLTLLRLHGTATVFVNGSGAIMEKHLQPGESLVVDTESVVAFSETVNYEVRTAGSCFAMCCGGEGFFNTVLTGPGLVILQSMTVNKLRRALHIPPPPAPQQQGLPVDV
jgi:uncharacterized protein (AIM24 family)